MPAQIDDHATFVRNFTVAKWLKLDAGAADTAEDDAKVADPGAESTSGDPKGVEIADEVPRVNVAWLRKLASVFKLRLNFLH